MRLGAKQLRGQDQLVAEKLARMWQHLLRPLGAGEPHASQQDAVATYRRLRNELERRCGDAAARGLGDTVIARLQAAGLSPAGRGGDPR